MFMLILHAAGILLAAAGYLEGLRRWIYHGKLWAGLVSIFLCFPLLIVLTAHPPVIYLRGIPLVGVGMFIHRYRSRILMQIKLLWFTTLSVLVVQGYYLLLAFRAGH
jgi:hypothetical protein